MKFAVIENKTLQHPGDERSRTNPGHGYPAYSESIEEFKEFKNEAEMQAYVEQMEKRTYGKAAYKIISFEELAVRTTVSVEVVKQ
jgi:hypothetical protein